MADHKVWKNVREMTPEELAEFKAAMFGTGPRPVSESAGAHVSTMTAAELRAFERERGIVPKRSY